MPLKLLRIVELLSGFLGLGLVGLEESGEGDLFE